MCMTIGHWYVYFIVIVYYRGVVLWVVFVRLGLIIQSLLWNILGGRGAFVLLYIIIFFGFILLSFVFIYKYERSKVMRVFIETIDKYIDNFD